MKEQENTWWENLIAWVITICFIYGVIWAIGAGYSACYSYYIKANKVEISQSKQRWLNEKKAEEIRKSREVYIKIFDEGSLVYSGFVTYLEKFRYRDGAYFIDANGNNQEVYGNIIVDYTTREIR